MPVEEPSEYGLWSDVGPKVHWPETNEDQMADLGRQWSDVGAPFLYAGTSLNEENSLGGAWQDDAGRKYVSTLGSLRSSAESAGTEMKRLGGLAKAFGEDVLYTKNSIVHMIAENEGAYQRMALFGWLFGEASGQFADKVANAINQFIDQMAERIANRGKGGRQGPRPTLNTDPNAPATPPGALGQCTPDNPTGAIPPPGSGETHPSGDPDPDAEPRGDKEVPKRPDAETARSVQRQNESAEILAKNGYDVEQLKKVPGQKSPDLRIEGQTFDVYSPGTGNVRNIASNIEGKVVDGQTDRVVLNLADSPASVNALRSQLNDYPIDGLREVKIIDRNGTISHLYP